MTDLKGRVALVTGSSRSMGAEIARTLAACGAHVVVNARSSGEEAEAVAEECRALSGKSLAVVADVSMATGAEKLCKAALSTFGKVDILVNNVGVSPRVKFLDSTFEDWQKTFDINLNSVYRTAQLIAPSMIAGRWGRIVNITGHAHYMIIDGIATMASKAAVVGLTRGLAAALAPYQITANDVAPSKIDTPERRNKYYVDKDPSWDPKARGVEQVPLKRLGKMSEIAGTVRFLCSEEAAYITGQTILVNGGVMAL